MEDGLDFDAQGNPESFARFAAGISFSLNDDKDAAFEQFQKAASSDPTNEVLVIEVARGLISKKQATNALPFLEQSARRPQASASINCWLALAQSKSGLTNQAIVSANKAIKKRPKAFEGYQTLFIVRMEAAQYPEALAALRRATKKIDPSPESLIGIAQLYSQYIAAHPADSKTVRPAGVALVDRAVSGHSLSEQMAWIASMAYERLDEPQKAATILTQADVGKDDTSAARRERLARLYMQSGDKKNAATQLQSLVRDYPARFPHAWFLLGTLAVDVQEFPSAINFFEKAIFLDPTMEAAYYNLALAQIDAKKNAEALETLQKARSLFATTFTGEYFAGIAASRLKDWKEATRRMTSAEVIARASDGKQLDASFYFHFGSAAERNHQIDQAVTCFETCIKLNPDMHEAMNYLGYMWAERGENLERARALIETAVKAEPTNAAYLDSMGWVLFKQNNVKDALPWLIKARDYSEEPDATLYDHLGDAFAALGDKKQAREAFEKSLSIEANDAIKKKLNDLTPP
jgi:tetratricopeptide (TPR) repeat protein